MDETHALGSEPWETIGWELLDLTRLITWVKYGPSHGWPADLEKILQYIDDDDSVEDHVDAVGQRLAQAAQGAVEVPKNHVGLAWWIYAELHDFPADAPGHDRAIALATRWRHHLEQAYGTVTVTG